jgi:transcriptional regulator with XRE-family HTH domain
MRGRKKGETWKKKLPDDVELGPLAMGIEYWRERRGLMKADIAQNAGISAASITQATRGDRISRPENIDAIARALGVSTGALYSRIDDDILEWVRANQDLVRAMKLALEISREDLALFKTFVDVMREHPQTLRKILAESGEHGPDGDGES